MNHVSKFQKPRIGILGLMTDGYEPIFPGIIERQENFAKKVAASISDIIEPEFAGAGLNRESIESITDRYNAMELDGILIILLTYSQGSWIIRALQNNRLPIAVAVIQQARTVGRGWDELELTVNQGLHGAQDNCNTIARLGIPCEYFAGDWETPRFRRFVEDFGKAAATLRFLKRMRVAVIGKMPGMNDILADEMSVFKKIGPEYVHDTLGPVYRNMEQVSKAAIDERIELDKKIFDIDPKLSYDSHAYAVKFYIGIKKYLFDGRFDAFTIHFDNVSGDGRFKQLPLMAASHLMAEGYGYAAEGDSLCASMVAAAQCLGNGGANFTEMYTMDFDCGAIIFCHAGEGNWATCGEGIKPKLIDRFLGEGGLENPPTPIFIPKTGSATLTSLTPICGDKFRLVLAKGQVLPKNDLTHCEMPYFFWSPDCGVEPCIEGWIKNGGTHHEVISLGDMTERWRMLSHYLGVEYVKL
jgi:L-arabinose isomerase